LQEENQLGKREDKMKKCNNCGKGVPDEASFCPYCGSGLNVKRVKYCDNCGAELPQDAKFCIVCGNRLAQTQVNAGDGVASTKNQVNTDYSVASMKNQVNTDDSVASTKTHKSSVIDFVKKHWIVISVAVMAVLCIVTVYIINYDPEDYDSDNIDVYSSDGETTETTEEEVKQEEKQLYVVEKYDSEGIATIEEEWEYHDFDGGTVKVNDTGSRIYGYVYDDTKKLLDIEGSWKIGNEFEIYMTIDEYLYDSYSLKNAMSRVEYSFSESITPPAGTVDSSVMKGYLIEEMVAFAENYYWFYTFEGLDNYAEKTGYSTEWKYDEQGNLIFEYAYTDNSNNRYYRWEYDDFGNKISEAVYVDYDDIGGVDVSVDEMLIIVDNEIEKCKSETYYYNSDHAEYIDDVYEIENEYDDDKLVKSSWCFPGRYWGEEDYIGLEYEYDDYGNVLKESYSHKDGSVYTWNEYEYDSAGNTLKETRYEEDGIDKWWEYEYNSDGSLRKKKEFNSDGSVREYYIYEYYDNTVYYPCDEDE
jgi:hypothetical protein